MSASRQLRDDRLDGGHRLWHAGIKPGRHGAHVVQDRGVVPPPPMWRAMNGRLRLVTLRATYMAICRRRTTRRLRLRCRICGTVVP
jgi:hypothetical protein